VRYVLRNGVQWRDLPCDMPAWQSVYYHFAKWRDEGIWKRINKRLRKRLRKRAGRKKNPSVGIVDSQAVKGTVHVGNGYDGGKKVNGRKRHLLVDTLGLLLTVVVTKANISDQASLKQLLAAISDKLFRLELIKADEAYRGQDFSAWVEETYQRSLEIVKRPEGAKGFQLQAQRWIVERTLAWLGNYRRLSKDYEVLSETSEAFICLAMVDIMTKRLAGCSTPAFR
ncbi:MAG: IS5 family transposase, partial [Chloroflexota bacterium]|nr:IS5 family transposase [Chloroflexota bacterium]